jgi:diadenosine tetraphosphate (Ap4A) HIT family hydrolase/HKD family nuclease
MTGWQSPFLAVPTTAWIASNDLAFAFPDGFPVSLGHSLIVTKRVVSTWFEATADEQRAIIALVDEVKALLERRLPQPPDGWNVGFNAGAAAGQTVPHLHVHLIPRWHGDVPDPRGGVRHVIPGRGNYLVEASRGADLCTGHPDDPFLQRLLPELPGAREVDILAAFVQDSGVDLVEEPLLAAVRDGAIVRILAGDYLGISAPVALQRLLALGRLCDPSWPPGAGISLRVAETERLRSSPVSFHPKSWRIRREDRTIVWVGSSNLSYAALTGGVEWNLRATSQSRPDACAAVGAAFLARWSQATSIDEAWLASYAQRRVQFAPRELAPDMEPVPTPIEPRPWQSDVLARLQELRVMGNRRALASVATGMGKTVLAALDAAQVSAVVGAPIRVLVVAHRAEILAQAACTLRHVLGLNTAAETWCLGNAGDLSGRLVLASVQKLARPEVLERLAAERFDYEPMHALCRFFLEHSGPTHRAGDRRMLPILVDMGRLFELFVFEWLKLHVSDRYLVRGQENVQLAMGQIVSIKIDITVRDMSTGASALVLETKYKAPVQPAADDIQQVVAYAAAKCCRRAVLVYPTRLPGVIAGLWGKDIHVELLAFRLDGDIEECGQEFLAQLPLGEGPSAQTEG